MKVTLKLQNVEVIKFFSELGLRKWYKDRSLRMTAKTFVIIWIFFFANFYLSINVWERWDYRKKDRFFWWNGPWISKNSPEWPFGGAILWMKIAARNKQILSAAGFLTKSSRYWIKKTIFQFESKMTKTKIVFRARLKKASHVTF